MNQPTLFSPFQLTCRSGVRQFDRPAVMGILNITSDSFYDGGRYTTPHSILSHARQLIADGADIIDIGAVSSRPGAQLLSPEEEAGRLVPVIQLLRNELPSDTILSVDTCFSLPAEASFHAGADIINDIAGGQLDPQMIPLVNSLHIPYVLMHMRGTPATMQLPSNTSYDDIIATVTIVIICRQLNLTISPYEQRPFATRFFKLPDAQSIKRIIIALKCHYFSRST